MISGNEIMFLRKMAGYKSQAALADAIGVSRSAVKEWEGGGIFSPR
jgi:DNA-binding transcriptional regulator YiaG